MNYTIRNISHGPHDWDEDTIYFTFEVHFTEPEIMQVNYSYHLDDLLPSLQTTQSGFYEYYKTTRSGLDKWGPAEVQTLEAMGPEAMNQVYQFLEDYLLTCDWVPKLFEREKQILNMTTEQQKQQQEGAKKIVKTLAPMGSPGIKISIQRDRMFCEQASRKMRELALDVYPEIANLEAEELKEFKHIFTREIMSMSDRIQKLLYS